MAIESVLARNYIEFSVRGFPGVTGAINTVHAGLRRVRAAAQAVAVPFAALGQRLGALTGIFARLSALGAGFAGFFGRAALKDTVEGERLSQTFDDLARTVGEIFVPYARRLTEILGFVTQSFRDLDPETKNSIAKFTLLGTGIAALAAATLPLLSSALTATAAAITLLTSPVGLLTGAVLGLGAAYVYAAGEGDTFGDKLDSIHKKARQAAVGFRLMGEELAAFVGAFTTTGSLDAALAARERATERVLAATKDFVEGGSVLPKQVTEGLERFRAVSDEIQQKLALLTATMNNVQGGGGGLLGMARGVVDLFRRPLDFSKATAKPVQFKANFESFQGTFERLQKGLIGQGDDVDKKQLAKLDAIEQRLQEGIKILNLPAAVA